MTKRQFPIGMKVTSRLDYGGDERHTGTIVHCGEWRGYPLVIGIHFDSDAVDEEYPCNRRTRVERGWIGYTWEDTAWFDAKFIVPLVLKASLTSETEVD